MTDNKDGKYKGFLDMLAINALVKTITNFIMAIIKVFNPNINIVEPRKKKTPLKDLLDRWFK